MTTPTPKSLDEIEQMLGKNLGLIKYDQPEDYELSPFGGMWVDQDGKSGRNLKPLAKKIQQLCLSEFLEMIGENEKLQPNPSNSGTNTSRRGRNQLRADLRTKALDKWSANG